MHTPSFMIGAFALAAVSAVTPAVAQIEVVVTPQGPADRPFANGAMTNVLVTVRNTGKDSLGRIDITARFDGFTPLATEVWRVESGSAVSLLERLAAGERTERTLRLRVTNAPVAQTKWSVAVNARARDGTAGTGETQIVVADCIGAYRAKLETLRPTISQGVQEAADRMRRIDPTLPTSRSFPVTGARSGDLASAERLASTVAAQRGADSQMATEWFRYMLLRWASELNAYTSQPPNPGLCANNYYQIAGYRQGLLPITRHLDTIRNAAAAALKAARETAKIDGNDDVFAVVRRLVKETAPQATGENENSFAMLAAARAALGPRTPADASRSLSLAETAAWLDAADRRGQALSREIDQLLGTIAAAHKESCSCAF